MYINIRWCFLVTFKNIIYILFYYKKHGLTNLQGKCTFPITSVFLDVIVPKGRLWEIAWILDELSCNPVLKKTAGSLTYPKHEDTVWHEVFNSRRVQSFASVFASQIFGYEQSLPGRIRWHLPRALCSVQVVLCDGAKRLIVRIAYRSDLASECLPQKAGACCWGNPSSFLTPLGIVDIAP